MPREDPSSIPSNHPVADSSSGSGSQDDTVIEEAPKFRSRAEELKWKLNQARKKLRAAKQYVALADKVARLKHKPSSGSQSVKDIIKKAEVTLVHAGENMGLDYVHYRRSVGR